jgi:O-antigen/teichoic acid export membrane protein
MLTRLSKDVAVYGASDFVFKVLAFAVFPVYAHAFSVHDFGVIELVTVSSGFVTMVCMLGLNNSVQRFYWDVDTSRSRQQAIVTTGLVLQCCASLVIVASALAAIYPFMHELEARYGIPWKIAVLALASIVPAVALQFVLDVLRLHFSPWRYATVAFLRNALGTGLGLILILAWGFGITGVFFGAAIAGVIAMPLGLWMIARDLQISFDWDVSHTLFQFGYPFVFSGAAYWIFGSLDRWMLAQLSNVEDVGLYGIAFKFAMIIMFLNTAFGQAWSPWAMKIYSEQIDYRTVYSQVLSLWFFVLTLASSLVALFAKELLMLTSPESYWSATNVIIIAVMGMVYLGTTQVTAVGISLEKRTHLFALIAWSAAIVNFIFNLLLIPRFGAVGAAIATTATYLGLSLMYLYWTQRLHPLPLDWLQMYWVFLVGILVVPAAWALNTYTTGLLIILIKFAIPVCMIILAWNLGLFTRISTDWIGARPRIVTAK